MSSNKGKWVGLVILIGMIVVMSSCSNDELPKYENHFARATKVYKDAWMHYKKAFRDFDSTQCDVLPLYRRDYAAFFTADFSKSIGLL